MNTRTEDSLQAVIEYRVFVKVEKSEYAVTVF